MKKIFFLTVFSMLLCGGFTSCGDDDDDPLTGEAAKEMIKGKWNVTSNYMESNSSEMDKFMNDIFGQVLKQGTVSMVYKENIVETTITIKETGQTEIINEKYYFQNDKLYVVYEENGSTEIYKYVISKNKMKLTMDVSRSEMVRLISESFEGTGLAETIIAQIPSNYSGRVIMEFKR